MMVRFTYSSCYYAMAVVILAVHMNDDCCIAFTPIVVSQQRPTTSSLWMVRIAYIQTDKSYKTNHITTNLDLKSLSR